MLAKVKNASGRIGIFLIKDREILDLIVEYLDLLGLWNMSRISCRTTAFLCYLVRTSSTSGTASGCSSGTTSGILYRTTSQALIELF